MDRLAYLQAPCTEVLRHVACACGVALLLEDLESTSIHKGIKRSFVLVCKIPLGNLEGP